MDPNKIKRRRTLLYFVWFFCVTRKEKEEVESIILDKNQSKAIAQVMYGDVKSYCEENIERYFPWWLDELRKERGKPPRRTIGKKAEKGVN
jgi:hypothetical protein